MTAQTDISTERSAITRFIHRHYWNDPPDGSVRDELTNEAIARIHKSADVMVQLMTGRTYRSDWEL